MRKNSSKPSHQDDDVLLEDLQEMSDDEFFDKFEGKRNRQRAKRKLKARRQIERYKEDRELARWINDSHLER